ncbi:hypothetical protein L195_g042278 [Trifolium pratense]|uniref:Uncharacterized protein n=1 Tax=Trifolium pratense TaxID=57577 RepID=A0A2K3M5X7_TRIPR|nr:hypothetical protein L195_g042278 [Trifolium pratense]
MGFFGGFMFKPENRAPVTDMMAGQPCSEEAGFLSLKLGSSGGGTGGTHGGHSPPKFL